MTDPAPIVTSPNTLAPFDTWDFPRLIAAPNRDAMGDEYVATDLGVWMNDDAHSPIADLESLADVGGIGNVAVEQKHT
jgi:hypothetical protein